MIEPAQLFRSLRLLLPTTKQRRVQAAKAVLVSICAFDKLEGAQRVKVDDELVQIYKPFGLYPWWRFRKDVPVYARAADRAIAMWRLGIATGIPDLSWDEVLHPWHRCDPALLMQDFHFYHADTDDALAYLEPRGLCLPEGVHFGRRWHQQAVKHH